MDGTGGRASVVALDSLVYKGGNSGGGVRNSLRDGVDGWDDVSLGWVGNCDRGLNWNSFLSGLLDLRNNLSLLTRGIGCSVDNRVVLVVHSGVVVVRGGDKVLGIGIRLCKGHGGESEKYELEKKFKINFLILSLKPRCI